MTRPDAAVKAPQLLLLLLPTLTGSIVTVHNAFLCHINVKAAAHIDLPPPSRPHSHLK
jgi:hypothetical protein